MTDTPRRPRIPRFRQSPLHTARKRLGQAAGRWLANRFGHRHTVRRVRLGANDYKRLRLGDASLAREIEQNLERFETSGIFPRVEARFDDELLLELVAGEPLVGFDGAVADALAAFYATLYRPLEGQPPVPANATPFPARARRDLRFLCDARVIDPPALADLERALETLATAEVLIGHDYTDALPKNFVRRPDGRLVGIDAAALQRDRLVGTGIAKSIAHGDAGYGPAFFDAFPKHSPLRLGPAMPFVDLCFHAAWLKRLYLKGRARRLEPARLERFRNVGSGPENA